MSFDIPSIIEKYSQGYFLMTNDNGDLGWYFSRQRTIIPLDHRFRYPTSLKRVLNQERFKVRINGDFAGVCAGCADRETTWISEELIELYQVLNRAGWAYSFETWQGDELAGGILGIVIGGMFIGESMFYRIPDGSKVAMVKLVEHLRNLGFILFDAQLQNEHLARFGSVILTPKEYEVLRKKALNFNCVFKTM